MICSIFVAYEQERARKEAESSLSRIEQGSRSVRALAVRTIIKTRPNEEMKVYADMGSDVRQLLAGTEIKTQNGIEYRFRRFGGAAVVSIFNLRRDSHQVNLDWLVRTRSGELIFEFWLDMDTMPLRREAQLGNFHGAKVRFIMYREAEVIDRYHLSEITRIELLSNPGSGALRLICFDIQPTNWQQQDDSQIWRLETPTARINIESADHCRPYTDKSS